MSPAVLFPLAPCFFLKGAYVSYLKVHIRQREDLERMNEWGLAILSNRAEIFQSSK